jgi:hypothetical protein
MPAGPSVSLWASIGTLVLAIAVVRCALVPPAARGCRASIDPPAKLR